MEPGAEKKVAAALAAVSEWMAEEEAAAVFPRPPAPGFTAWAMAGRQEIMSVRSLVAARLWK